MTHPNAIDLEAFACGDSVASVAAHVDECAPCRAFVARAKGASPRIDVAPILDRARRAEKKRVIFLASSVAVPLAAAAAALLVLRAPAPGPLVAASDPPPNTATAYYVERAPMPDTRFKGGVQLAVVRERAGAQSRFVGPVPVKPGDRLRVEVALDRSVVILGAVMGDDGSWVELMPEGVRESGTHFSEKAVRVDAQPMSGTIFVGSPDGVRRARAHEKADDVRSIRIEWEGP
jgi:hypothetical protein